MRLILGLTLVLGFFVRFFPVLKAGFPINDGGMFLVMIRDLKSNGLLLPAFTSYNMADIPFTYPPLGFYLAAAISFLGIPEIEILRWLPMVVNLISILAVYLLASNVTNDRPFAALTAGFYGLIPGGYGWYIMGGGLTRGLGGLFLVLSVASLIQVFRKGLWKDIVLTSVLCALAILSHPEAAIHTAASCALVWLFFGRSLRSSLHAALIALGAIAFSSPWWLTNLNYHGPQPFISALYSGNYGASPVNQLFRDVLSRGSMIPLILLLRVAGIAWAAWDRKFFILAWMAIPYVVEPRSAPAVSYYPFSMLIALGLTGAFFNLVLLFKKRFRSAKPNLEKVVKEGMGETVANPPHWYEIHWMNLTILTLFFYLFFDSLLYSFPLINTSLKKDSVEAMEWARANTPVASSFLILRGESGVMVDPVQEWFPALAQRHSNTTLQGLEWTLNSGFTARLIELSDLQDCEEVTCVEDWADHNGLNYTHLMVDHTRLSNSFLSSIYSDPTYKLIFENDRYNIYVTEP